MKTPPNWNVLWGYGAMARIKTVAKGSTVELSAWRADVGSATPIASIDDPSWSWVYLSGQHPRTAVDLTLEPEWCARVFDDPSRLSELGGVFGLLLLDKRKNRLLVAADRIGVQAIYYARDKDGILCISTHLMWLLLTTGHEGAINAEGLVDHFAFGFAPTSHRQVYAGIERVPAGTALLIEANDGRMSTYKYYEVPSQNLELQSDGVSALASSIESGALSPLGECVPFIGLTAGKDSLCIAATIAKQGKLASGTFGFAGSADRNQGQELSRVLGWEHVEGGICPDSSFSEQCTFVAFHSAGLATASYVDMSFFASTALAKSSAYVMGEGGESVREHFHVEVNDRLAVFADSRTTPAEWLFPSLRKDMRELLSDYPRAQSLALEAFQRERSESLAVNWSRLHWMPNNACLRHAVLSAIRPKISPYLDARFIGKSFPLKQDYYVNNRLVRSIIASSCPKLLKYWEHPLESPISTQHWYSRFEGPCGRNVQSLLQLSLPYCSDLLDIDYILRLCADNLKKPSRAIWHLLRVLSFASCQFILKTERHLRLPQISANVRILGTSRVESQSPMV